MSKHEESSHKVLIYPNLEQEIESIYNEGCLPLYSPGNWDLKRWQREEWPSALHFSTGDGRYNAPEDSFKVCYMADRVVSALAESFGRIMHKNGNQFVEERVLSTSRICLIRPRRKLAFVDVGQLLGMLHITLDVCTGDDYTVTQRVIACLYKLAKEKAEGVCYFSRHFSTTFACISETT